MNDNLFAEIAQWLDAGTAPGGAVTLRSPDGHESFTHGQFAGASSPAVTTDTVYDVASITKLFTTALILRLHDRKLLSIDDRCADYLENFHSSDITITDLLTHRAPLGIMLQEYRAKYPDGNRLRQALLTASVPASSADVVMYANAEFFYLGMIIEQVTKRSLQDEMHRLFDELSLEHAYTGPDIARLRIRTPPTEVLDDVVIQSATHDETARVLGGLTGHAGVFSTAEDLAAFGTAWLDDRIICKATQELVFKDYDPSGTTPQALGWWLRVTGPDDQAVPTPGIYSHTGFTGSILAVNPSNGKVAAFVCNRTFYGRTNKTQRRIWQLLVTWLQS